MDKRRLGSDFDDFLREEGMLGDVSRFALCVIACQDKRMRRAVPISRSPSMFFSPFKARDTRRGDVAHRGLLFALPACQLRTRCDNRSRQSGTIVQRLQVLSRREGKGHLAVSRYVSSRARLPTWADDGNPCGRTA